MNRQSVILIGGFCEIYELCIRCGLEIAGVVDPSPAVVTGYDLPYLGTDEDVRDRPGLIRSLPLVIVPDAPLVRRRIVEQYRRLGCHFASVVSPDADVSETAERGVGVVIQSGVTVTARSRVGAFVKLNVGARVFHECDLGTCVTVAPGACLLGRVSVGDDAYIGASSVVLPGRAIGAGSTVGAGSVVTRDVAPNDVVVGIPARPARRKHADT